LDGTILKIENITNVLLISVKEIFNCFAFLIFASNY